MARPTAGPTTNLQQPTRPDVEDAPQYQSGYQAPSSDYRVGSAPVAEPERGGSILAGILTTLGGLLAIVSSFMIWASERGDLEGFELVRRVAAFDSNGWFAQGFGIALVVLGLLMLVGVGRQSVWGVCAAVCGIAILIAVGFSYFDITGQASENWVDFVTSGTQLSEAEVEDAGVGLGPSLGLWLGGLGGLIGALGSPLVKRRDE